jgi:hypothetical protein
MIRPPPNGGNGSARLAPGAWVKRKNWHAQDTTRLAGMVESYFVGECHRDSIRRLSGTFQTPAEAMRVLPWLRQRYPGAELVSEVRYYRLAP